MPVINIQLQGGARDASGQLIQAHPQIVLQQRGPVIQVAVGIATSMADQLVQQGQTLPNPVPGFALIDTGASATCIDADAALQLALPVIDVVTMSSASHASSEANIYAAHIDFVGLGISIEAGRAIGAALAGQGLVALIGRDILQQCTLHYNGITGAFSLAL